MNEIEFGPNKPQQEMGHETEKKPEDIVVPENIETRKPILNKESAEQFPPDQIDQEWRLITEAVRREILINPEVRNIAIEFIASPLSEALPDAFLDRLSVNQRVAKLADRYRSEIGNYLKLEAVPEDQITPDITNSQSFRTPESIIHMLQEMCGSNTPQYYEQLRKYVDHGVFTQGITAQERLMIAQRYRFARDVKLLALQAEVMEKGTEAQIGQNGEMVLPSGTEMNINNTEDKVKMSELMNPQIWEKRRQIKDRVYEIQVGSSKYILKERKTAMHTDTMKTGHKKGLTSLEEFKTAQDLQKNGAVEQGNIKVNWEKPLASVTFPDGFQFTVFECEGGFIEDNAVVSTLAQEIQNHREEFEQEFMAMQELAGKFASDPRVVGFEQGNTESGLKAVLRFLGLKREQFSELTFEEFAMAKALRMERQAMSLMTETAIKNGYFSKDHEGYSFKINSNGHLQLEIFGFDFEYFKRINPDEVEKTLQNHYSFERERTVDGIDFLSWNNGEQVTRTQRAAYFSMLKSEGLLN